MGAKEGESIELKCRLEEEMEEGECTVTWSFNETVITENERFMISFDGTYAKLFVSSLIMEDMGLSRLSLKMKKARMKALAKSPLNLLLWQNQRLKKKALHHHLLQRRRKSTKLKLRKKTRKSLLKNQSLRKRPKLLKICLN